MAVEGAQDKSADLTATLESYDVISAAQDADLQSIVRLAAQICDVPSASVNLLDDHEQHSVATENFPRGTVPIEESMCGLTVRLDAPVHVRDALQDPRFVDNVWVNGTRGHVRFYAGSQLRTARGLTVGTLCVFDTVERELEPGQRAALDDLAAQVVQILELRAQTSSLANTNSELRRSNADLSAFAGRVAHDLRNPIAATTGFLALAQNTFGEQLTGRARECVAHASAAVERMAAQVDDLLAYAGVGAQVREVTVSLTELTNDVVRDLQALVDSSGASVQVGQLPVVQSDPTLLRMLLLNLISNAIKYARVGVAPEVRVTGERSDARWSLAVADNGRGIPARDRGRVFELFSRLSNTGDVTGSGIGLATCARVGDALGAQITITDTAGGGTTMTFDAGHRP